MDTSPSQGPVGTGDPVSVFLLDDHEVVRRGIAHSLAAARDITVVGAAGTVTEALARIPVLNPMVAVLDNRLPDGSGIEVCREIRSSAPDTRCIILTSYDDDDAVLSAVLAGAAGYLLKDIKGSNLVEAIRQVAAGRSLLDPELAERAKTQVRDGASLDPRYRVLTAREREVLDLVTAGLTNREIAERLSLAEKAVKNYVSVMLTKLGMHRRAQAAVFGAEVRRTSH